MGETPTEQSAPSRWWALTLLLPVAALMASGCFVSGGVLVRQQLAGSPCRWAGVAQGLDGCESPTTWTLAFDTQDIALALLFDLVFALSVSIGGYFLLRTGWRHWAPDRRRQYGLWKHMQLVAAIAGAFDVAETLGQWAWCTDLDPPSLVTHAVAVFAWWKWVGYVVLAVGLFGLVLGPIAAPWLRPSLRWLFGKIDGPLGEVDRREPVPGSVTTPSGLGICASGGGIRSASIMIGAFRGLTERGIFQRAQWVHAVSGGGYAAGGWRVSSLERGEDGPDDNLFAVDHPWFRHVRARRRYLDNGVGSLVGGIVGAVARTTMVFGGVVAAAALAGWAAGWLTSSWAVHPDFANRGPNALLLSSLLAWRLVLPGGIALVVGIVLFVATRTTNSERFRRDVGAIAAVTMIVGVVLLGVLVAIPMGIRYGRPVLASPMGVGAEGGAGVIGFLSALGVATAVRQLLTAELKKRWSRLGGVALLLGLVLFAGKVADDRANDALVFRGGWVPLVAIIWLVVLEWPPAHRLTLNGVYRKRLAETFLPGVDYDEEPPWHAYATAGGPELVLCGTAHTTALQFGGLPALGFTFRPHGVTLHDGASAPWRSYPTGSWWDGYPRAWIVSRSMALTGAAFASAMGRQSFGSTNSLLAAVNLRLGMWVPNPRHADWFDDPVTSPRVHLGYFAKELFNRYDPERDAFVYVADGGHRENLGFVEQLREVPREVIVLDASGDRPGTFATMKQAMVLADVELGVEVDIDFSTVDARPDDEPLDCVAVGTATHPDGTITRVFYAKAQLSEAAPIALRQFGAASPPYPNYSTSDQFVTEEEFDRLVALGEHMADRVEVHRRRW